MSSLEIQMLLLISRYIIIAGVLFLIVRYVYKKMRNRKK